MPENLSDFETGKIRMAASVKSLKTISMTAASPKKSYDLLKASGSSGTSYESSKKFDPFNFSANAAPQKDIMSLEQGRQETKQLRNAKYQYQITMLKIDI